MREILYGILCGAVIMFLFFPERMGKITRIAKNDFTIGWESVR